MALLMPFEADGDRQNILARQDQKVEPPHL
jgi:hypothetical protein